MPRLRLRACRLPRPNRPPHRPIRPHRNRPSSMPASPRRLQPCRRRLRHPPQCRPLRLQPRPCPRPLRRLCRHRRCRPPLCHPLRRRLQQRRRPLPLPFRCRLRRRLPSRRLARYPRFRSHPQPPRRPPCSRRRSRHSPRRSLRRHQRVKGHPARQSGRSRLRRHPSPPRSQPKGPRRRMRLRVRPGRPPGPCRRPVMPGRIASSTRPIGNWSARAK